MSFQIITINFTKITYYINTPIHMNQKVNRKSHSILGADFMEKNLSYSKFHQIQN